MTKLSPDETYKNKEWLVNQHFNNRKPCNIIAKECGVCSQTIYRIMHKYNIKPIHSGRKMKDLTGKRFGRLIVVQPEEKRRRGYIVWSCKCDCGNTVSVKSGDLLSGNTCSCGCLNRELSTERIVRVTENNTIDMTGKRFGRWRVIERYEKEKSDGAWWLCRCDCGTIKPARGHGLRLGESKSCGCWAADMNSMKRGDKNPNWNPDITDEERKKTRHYQEYYAWRKAVFERDNYTCQKCEKIGGKLNAHHIQAYDANKDLRTTLENGVTLCKKCHKNFHHIYGYGNNTREQFDEFMLTENK